jgi:hypothetical protein
MNTLKRIGAAIVLGVSLTAAAQAADYDDAWHAASGREYRSAHSFEAPEILRDRRHREDYRRDFMGEGRFYGRPVPDWRRRWNRPVAFRAWGRHDEEDCRLIIKRRVNPWGEVSIRNVEVCR